MNKDELIKMLDTMDINNISGFVLWYKKNEVKSKTRKLEFHVVNEEED